MAFWDRITSRGHVEDRRSMVPAIGGVGVTGLAVLMLLNLLAGGDPADILNQLQTVPVTEQGSTEQFDGVDSYEQFASSVLGSANDAWTVTFKAEGNTYSEPRLVLFRAATESSCGTATSRVGPHYCPLDSTIYLDETFFDELTSRLGAKGGDVAEAYVIAHEVGHHVQNQLGALDTQDSISLELQADCYAGLWAYSVKQLGIFEPGEINEAMDAASAVGDDRIQERVSGYINPETWTHGSSEQRLSWFTKGYETGDFESCNTFQ